MARDWIERGLVQVREREQLYRAAAERRAHQAAIVKEKAPDVARRLVAEVEASLDEYHRLAESESNRIQYEPLPHEGFCVTRIAAPRVELQCRPDYESGVVYCNLTRTKDPDTEPQELVFNLSFTVDDSDSVALCYETRTFHSAPELAELLLAQVLFPTLTLESFQSGRL
jgi:hypothetical protein